MKTGKDLLVIGDSWMASYVDGTGDTWIMCEALGVPPENRQAVFDSLDYLVLPPTIEDYSLMSDIIGQKLADAAAGSMTVQQALDEAQSECEAQITLS